MGEVRRPAWSTRAAVGVIAALTCAFSVYAVVAFTGRGDSVVGSRNAVLMGIDGRGESVVTTAMAIAVLAVSLLTASLAVGIARRREGARHAGFMTFGLLAFISLAAALPGVFADPPAPGAPVGVVVGLANVAVVALLLAPATADDFDLAQRLRERRATRVDAR